MICVNRLFETSKWFDMVYLRGVCRNLLLTHLTDMAIPIEYERTEVRHTLPGFDSSPIGFSGKHFSLNRDLRCIRVRFEKAFLVDQGRKLRSPQ